MSFTNSNLNNLQYSDMCFNTDWQFEAFKMAKAMDMILCVYMLISKCFFLIFSTICGRNALELPHRGYSNVFLQHMSFQ